MQRVQIFARRQGGGAVRDGANRRDSVLERVGGDVLFVKSCLGKRQAPADLLNHPHRQGSRLLLRRRLGEQLKGTKSL